MLCVMMMIAQGTNSGIVMMMIAQGANIGIMMTIIAKGITKTKVA